MAKSFLLTADDIVIVDLATHLCHVVETRWVTISGLCRTTKKLQTRHAAALKFSRFASGVGKSFRMFDEGKRRRDRGQDVVVGLWQAKVPAEIQPLWVHWRSFHAQHQRRPGH